MRHLRNVGLAVLVLASSASVALAQRTVRTSNAPAAVGGYWEFGVDFAALDFGLNTPSTTDLTFGGGSVRAGRFISDVMSIEPLVAFLSSSTGSGGGSNSLLGVEVGVPYHFQADRTVQQWYVRPLAMFQRTSINPGGAAPSTTTNRVGIGAGFGVKMPSKKNTKFTWRAEVTYKNLLKSEIGRASCRERV